MNTAIRHTTSDRNRALARLRTFTTGTAIASVAAFAGFGSLAALTNPGHSATSTSSGGATQATVPYSNGDTSSNGGSNDGSNGDDGTNATTLTPNLGIPTTPFLNVAGPAQVTTGGS